MIDGFHRLRHNTIVGCYNNNSDICYFCSTSTHSRKGFMTRCIQESNTTAVRQLHIISTNMLSDTTRFTGNHIRITDIIQQRSLTMVNVSHHRNNRWTRNPIFFVIFIFICLDCFNYISTYIFRLETELFSNNINCFSIQTLVDRNHNTDTHASRYDFRNRHIHHISQIVSCNEFG